ncbi:site-specific DNA-methyltransferase [Buchananella hordeovulneris]|uniref:site-specific DNA-methyltransferase n=1 Tax=Buchananella hordeovulneris TaxID=52770 RepID=UPI000F5D6A40|nr:site-specific DNA-methyltransferase [Buchananella hordeovulneris]RRD44943.1 site-specific DNA-methyltransferase [Buchananella hordeovulneris]
MTSQKFNVSGSSPNFRTELARKLACMAPEIINDGKLDVQKLAELLDDDASIDTERFGLVWPGKRHAQRLAQTPTTATLLPDHENSINWETTQNVFIEGDNLEVLKVLQRHYYGKISTIFIDPPYNTGSDFVYADNYTDGINAYLEWSGQSGAEGAIRSNTESNGRFHSAWLSLMYPRLKLARNLLSEDGVIFIAIGTRESANLRVLCDEIFGETNFIASFIWEKTQHFGRQKVNSYSNYDSILCYARRLYTPDGTKKELLVEYVKNEFEDAPLYNASNPENTIRFPAGTVRFNLQDGVYHESSDEKYVLLNPVIVSDGLNANDFSLKFRSRWSAATIEEEAKKGTRYWVKTKTFAIRAIYAEGKSFNESPREIIFTNRTASNVTRSRSGQSVGTNEEGSAEIAELLGKSIFDYPKPVSLIKYLLSLVQPGIVLDFFSGSGTTAAAVLEMNAARDGNRSFIMVQLPEPTPVGSNARESGFDTIADIACERIRRAGVKISKDRETMLDERAKGLDIGFRAYRLAETNFTKWQVNANVTENELEDLFSSAQISINDSASPEALFVEILIKLGLPLTENYKQDTIADLDVFNIKEGLILGYFSRHVKPTLEQLRELVEATEVRLILLEEAFQGDDELKTNLTQLCKTRGVELSIA